ncbi:hypothetical protein GJAV_G00011910 [Gymnothorax javanicus]|nr:hypothetical protein GJAV_G00011910 [Gymnothorax javanicus]
MIEANSIAVVRADEEFSPYYFVKVIKAPHILSNDVKDNYGSRYEAAVLSVPVPADQVDTDYIKVLTCIVEVIADTLRKPSPIIISKECQDALTGGISEGGHQVPQKKNGEDSNQVTEALGGHSSMEDTREQSRSRSGSSENGDSAERSNEVEQESRESSAESREGNEIGGTNKGGVVEETEEEKEKGGGMKEKDEENSKEHHSSSVEKEKGERRESGESHSSSSEEDSKGKEGNETEEDNSSQESKDGKRQKLKSDSASESHEEHSMEGKPDKSSYSMSISESESSEKNYKREAEEEDMEGKPEKRRNEDGQVAIGGRIKMERRQGSPRLLRYTPQHSKEKSGEEGVVRRSPEAQELHMMARGEMEEKRGEEEGSASHRGEENEIANLAAIELELENVAQKLHELRRA